MQCWPTFDLVYSVHDDLFGFFRMIRQTLINSTTGDKEFGLHNNLIALTSRNTYCFVQLFTQISRHILLYSVSRTVYLFSLVSFLLAACNLHFGHT